MVKKLALAAMLLIAASTHAETFKFFGSAGAEWQLTPANAASPLNPGNIAQLPYSTGSADAVAFFDATPDSRAWKLHLKLRGDAAEGGNQTSHHRHKPAKAGGGRRIGFIDDCDNIHRSPGSRGRNGNGERQNRTQAHRPDAVALAAHEPPDR